VPPEDLNKSKDKSSVAFIAAGIEQNNHSLEFSQSSVKTSSSAAWKTLIILTTMVMYGTIMVISTIPDLIACFHVSYGTAFHCTVRYHLLVNSNSTNGAIGVNKNFDVYAFGSYRTKIYLTLMDKIVLEIPVLTLSSFSKKQHLYCGFGHFLQNSYCYRCSYSRYW
jgi:hypothetical protein